MLLINEAIMLQKHLIRRISCLLQKHHCLLLALFFSATIQHSYNFVVFAPMICLALVILPNQSKWQFTRRFSMLLLLGAAGIGILLLVSLGESHRVSPNLRSDLAALGSADGRAAIPKFASGQVMLSAPPDWKLFRKIGSERPVLLAFEDPGSSQEKQFVAEHRPEIIYSNCLAQKHSILFRWIPQLYRSHGVSVHRWDKKGLKVWSSGVRGPDP